MPAGQPIARRGRISKLAKLSAAPYWEASREPLCCLVFLCPLVLAYETGALLLRPQTWPEQRLVAPSLIQHLAAWFGTDGAWVPGAALLATLLLWQVWSRKPWRVRGRDPLLMVFESVLLTVPLFVIRSLLQPLTADPETQVGGLRVLLVLALGAAVYEELVFRFYLVGGLRHLLGAARRVPRRAATPTAIGLGALVFAACHFGPIGSEAFAWPYFLMLVGAGAYLATIFVFRGLGVSTGCHAAFNLILLITGW